MLGTEAHLGFGRFLDNRPKNVFGHRIFDANDRNRNRELSGRLVGRLLHINGCFAPCSRLSVWKKPGNFRVRVGRHIATSLLFTIQRITSILQGAHHKSHEHHLLRYWTTVCNLTGVCILCFSYIYIEMVQVLSSRRPRQHPGESPASSQSIAREIMENERTVHAACKVENRSICRSVELAASWWRTFYCFVPGKKL